jgi:glycerol uptake facilitator-like aquaporin
MSNADTHGEGRGMWNPVVGPLIGGVLSGLVLPAAL